MPNLEAAYEEIHFEVDENVARITFQRNHRRNAMSVRALRETLQALWEAESRDDVGAVLISGDGEAFCSGFDLKEIPVDEGFDRVAVVAHFREAALWWHQMLHKIARLPKPVLAAVNGVAAGGGFGIMLAADLAVCSEDASFICAWHTIGIGNDSASSYTLSRMVGMRRAMDMMLTNRTLSAVEALEWGLVSRVYAKEDLNQSAMEIAASLANAPTHLQAMAKERFHMGWTQSIEECTEFEVQNVLTSVAHPHFQQTLEAFLAGTERSNAVQVNLP